MYCPIKCCSITNDIIFTDYSRQGVSVDKVRQWHNVNSISLKNEKMLWPGSVWPGNSAWISNHVSPLTTRMKPNGRVRLILDLSYPHTRGI